MKYTATFVGRGIGAIGVFYPITALVEGLNEKDARLKLYNRYEHITHLKLTEVKDHEHHNHDQHGQ